MKLKNLCLMSSLIFSIGMSSHSSYAQTDYQHDLNFTDESEIFAELSNDFKDEVGFEDSYDQEERDLNKTVVIPISKAKGPKVKLLASLGVVGILMVFDEPIMELVQRHKNKTTESLAALGNHFGSDYLPPLVAGTYALGVVFKDKKMRETAVEAIESVILAEIVTETMKAATHRARPDDNRGAYDFDGPGWTSDNTSFPSGHSTGAWAVATIYAKKYQHKKLVPLVAYGLATVVSLSRIHDNKHWASDALLGALVGYTSANYIFKLNKRRRNKRRVFVSADVKKNYKGIAVDINLGDQKDDEEEDEVPLSFK